MKWLVAALALLGCRNEPAARLPALQLPVVLPPLAEQQAALADALAKHHRTVFDRNLDAHDPGELREHIAYYQQTIDRLKPSPADLFRAGDDQFAYQFRPENGLGNGLRDFPAAGNRPTPNLRRVANGEFGGPEAMACADCHSVGGDDGAGSLTQNVMQRGDGDRTSSGDLRSAPALLGVGPVQRLAIEMTAELQAARATGIEQARAAGMPVTIMLTSKGVAFGELAVAPNGSVDTTKVVGVANDLVVRPFGWKGHQANLRGMVREAFRLHLGMVATVEQEWISQGILAPTAYGNVLWTDVDNDGVSTEADDGMVTTMVAYLAQLEVPVTRLPQQPIFLPMWSVGRDLFSSIGCSSCHRPSLQLNDAHFVTAPEMKVAGSPVHIDVAHDGLQPKPTAIPGGFAVELFSDLKRHHMGPGLAAAMAQPAEGGAIANDVWLTRPLWGLADSAPYLHDGRATTVRDAIVAHGGEADAARLGFEQAPAAHQQALLVYLLSLARTPHPVVP